MIDSILFLPSMKVLLTQGVQNWTLTEAQLQDKQSPQKVPRSFASKETSSLTYLLVELWQMTAKTCCIIFCNGREQNLDCM